MPGIEIFLKKNTTLFFYSSIIGNATVILVKTWF